MFKYTSLYGINGQTAVYIKHIVTKTLFTGSFLSLRTSLTVFKQSSLAWLSGITSILGELWGQREGMLKVTDMLLSVPFIF